MAQFILRNLDARFWNELSTNAKLQGWPVQELIVQLLRDYLEGRVTPSAPAPRSKPRVVEGMVAIQFTCPHCNKAMEVDTEHRSGFGYMNFYVVDCPHCGKLTERSLPGDIVAVRAAGKPSPDQIISLPYTCPNGHAQVLRYQRHQLEDLLDEQELTLRCRICDQSRQPTAAESRRLHVLLHGT